MDRRERSNDLLVAIMAALDGFQSTLWTALPGIIQSFNAGAMTCTVQPAIQAIILDPQAGDFEEVTLPLLVDVPVCFPGGGGFTMTFPVAQGDECLVVFSSRCIDNWWDLGGVRGQAMQRMHDLSDGFAFVGVRSTPRVLSGVSTNSVQLRSDSGASKIEVKSDTINITTTATVNLTAPTVKLSNGGTARKLVNDLFKVFFNNHVHTSAIAGNPTSTPTVAMDDAKLTTVAQAE